MKILLSPVAVAVALVALPVGIAVAHELPVSTARAVAKQELRAIVKGDKLVKRSRIVSCDPQSDHRVDCLVRIVDRPEFDWETKDTTCEGTISVRYTSSMRPRIGVKQYGWDCW
jgi:hypothetical protein